MLACMVLARHPMLLHPLFLLFLLTIHSPSQIQTAFSLTMADILVSDASLDVPIQDDIHNRLDFYFDSLNKPWKAPLEFSMHVGLMCATCSDKTTVDICAFVAGDGGDAFSLLCPFAYFDRSLFQYLGREGIRKDLHMALLEDANQSGFSLMSDGT
jgi:hypothetical protein